MKGTVVKANRPVIVTTEFRGVFFGYVPNNQARDVDTIRLERARMAVSWSADVRGVLGLAATGPSASCRIGPQVPAVTLRKVTAVFECSDESARGWEKAPWTH